MKKAILFLMVLLIIPAGLAKEGHMKLMAVSENADGDMEGSMADLYLDIREGDGGVFIDTYPITKLDTQISTRFAKEIACDFLDINCNKYDFIYTIRGESSIIGGPSAGAAIAVLTATILDGREIREDIAITGTINSGGIIGPVAGLKEKIEAASKSGIRKVIIPNQEIEFNDSNISIDDYNITIAKVDELGEAVYEYNGLVQKESYGNLVIEEEYENTMEYLASKLCDKNKELQREISRFDIVNNSRVDDIFISENKIAVNLSNRGLEAFENRSYYSSASYCFGANVKLRHLLLILENMTKSEYFKRIEQLMGEIKEFNDEIDEKDKETITDLEAYMVVKERIKEAREYMRKSQENFIINESYRYDLAYAIERLYSAESWSEFFGKGGKKFDLGVENLKSSCLDKIGEAEERYQYARIFFPNILEDMREEVDYAYVDLRKGEYDLCLFKASKAKAEADLVLSVMGLKEGQIDNLIGNKIKVVERSIIKEIGKGVFPIIGYSYLEYAKSLKEDDKYSALLYLEYALELGSLDIYFKEKDIELFELVDIEKTSIFLMGLLVGALATLIIKRDKRAKGKKIRKKKK